MNLWGLELTDVSSQALLALVVVLILTGLLVPRATYRDKAGEADRWRAAYEAEREARAEAEEQSRQLIERTRALHDSLAIQQRGTPAPDAEG